jgi:hypothetical protein
MPKKQAHADAQTPVTSPVVPSLDIRPDGVYLPTQIRVALGLKSSSLRTEWRHGRLRVIRRCGKNYLLGRDVLEWLNGGEVPSPAARKEKRSEEATTG